MRIRLNVVLIAFIVALTSINVLAQLNPADVFKTVVKGQSFSDTISSRFQPSASLVKNCHFPGFVSLGSQKYRFTVLPPQSNPNYTGDAMVVIQYTDGTPPKPRYITYHVNFVNSRIVTKEDFVIADADNQATVHPLDNDFTTSGGLTLVGLAQVQGGTSVQSGNDIQFELEDGSDHGYVIYSVTDSLNAIANGVVHVLKSQTVSPQSDTLDFKLLNSRSQLVFMPAPGFAPVQNPSKGSVVSRHSMVFEYRPNSGATGNDLFVLQDSDNNSRVVRITLLARTENTSSVRDDRVYTPKNTPVTFDVFANDLSRNFPISAYSVSPSLHKDTLGIFTYTPPAGYSGVQNFSYTVNYGYYQQSGNIKIFIGNYDPDATQDYAFHTLKNKPLVLDYNVPVNGYTFNLLNDPQFGTFEIFDINTTIQQDCNEINNKLTMVYSPDANFYGADSFDVEYCVVNNPCKVYKIYIAVHDAQADTLCHCAGKDCVWSGDHDHNGRVSVADLLPLGRFIGLSGNVRDELSYPYYAGQHADNWNYYQPNGNNIKHIDSDGDGLLSVADTTGISDHYSKIHNFVPVEVLSFKEYDFNLIPNQTELDSGDVLILDIAIGSNQTPVKDVFGLAFALDLNPDVIDSASLSGHFYKDSWFTYGTSSLQMIKQPKDGVIHAAFTRTAGIVEDELEGFKPPGANGNGIIGQLVFIVEDELEGFKGQQNTVSRRISTRGIEMEDVEGNRYMLPDTYTDIKINLTKKDLVPSADKLIIYPNPVSDQVNLHFNGRNTIYGMRMFDMTGNQVMELKEVNAQSTQVGTGHLASGIYTLQVVTSEGVISRKITVSPRN